MVTSDVFDDMVLSAGIAGTVVAAWLSANRTRRRAMTEAGPHYPSREQTPEDPLNGNASSLVSHGWVSFRTGHREMAEPPSRRAR